MDRQFLRTMMPKLLCHSATALSSRIVCASQDVFIFQLDEDDWRKIYTSSNNESLDILWQSQFALRFIEKDGDSI
jgi:hypothetical protein